MKKNGFTLIELLAVIVILAIITLIATPIVLNVIEDSKLSAARVSANNYVRALDTVLLSNSTYEEEDTKHTCDIVLKNSESYIECDYIEEPLLVEVGGNKPSSGIIEVVNNKVVEYEIDIDGKTIYSTEPTSIDCFETSENEDETLTITKYLCGKNDKTKILDVIIPKRINSKKITKIGSKVFQSKGLLSVIIPESVVSIDSYAFDNNNLTSVIIPDKVNYIGTGGFLSNKLTDLKISKGLTSIGTYVFKNNRLINVEIPEGVTNIGHTAFANNLLTNIIIPNSAVNISYNAFHNNLLEENDGFIYKRTGTGVDYSTIIGYGGPTTTSLVIPSEHNGVVLKNIYSSAFISMGLTHVEIPNEVIYIGVNAFNGNKLTNIRLPEKLTSIEYGAFGYNNLESIEIPSNVTSIGISALKGNKLKTIEIPSSVMHIRNESFHDNQLTSVTIKGKSSISDFTSYPSTSPFGWAESYSDDNIVFEP